MSKPAGLKMLNACLTRAVVLLLMGASFLSGARPAASEPMERRYGLIIANEAYTGALPRLPGTQPDAQRLSAALKADGFEIIDKRNLSREEMREAIAEFAEKLKSQGEHAIGFVYFSGHGLADAKRGQNFLVPVDARFRGGLSSSELAAFGYGLNDMLDVLAGAHAHALVVVIDACRDVPMAHRGGAAGGLLQATPHADTLIAYSTSPGAVAADTGLYAQVLSEALTAPGATSRSVFEAVQTQVARRTHIEQVPQFVDGLLDPIAFTPGGVAASPEALNAWLKIRQSNKISDFQEFKKRYPNSDYAELADQAVSRLSSQPSTHINPEQALQTYHAGLQALNSRNYSLAKSLLTLSCDSSLVDACAYLGGLYEDGKGVAKNFDKARTLSEQTCASGSGFGCFVLAKLYRFGEGVEKDVEKSISTLDMACKSRESEACVTLGLMYQQGDGVAPDLAKAKRFFMTSVQIDGNKAAQLQLRIISQYQ